MTSIGALAAALARHRPGDARERASLTEICNLLATLPAPFDEHADHRHVTGSAIVLDPHGRVLLHRHKRLDVWLQPGGHLEPGEGPYEAAVRETREETGVAVTPPREGPTIVHVDVHNGGRGHVHLDIRYLLFAAGDATIAPSPGESPAVMWMEHRDAVSRADLSAGQAIEVASGAVSRGRLTSPARARTG